MKETMCRSPALVEVIRTGSRPVSLGKNGEMHIAKDTCDIFHWRESRVRAPGLAALVGLVDVVARVLAELGGRRGARCATRRARRRRCTRQETLLFLSSKALSRKNPQDTVRWKSRSSTWDWKRIPQRTETETRTPRSQLSAARRGALARAAALRRASSRLRIKKIRIHPNCVSLSNEAESLDSRPSLFFERKRVFRERKHATRCLSPRHSRHATRRLERLAASQHTQGID